MPIEIALAQTASDVVILAFDGRILEIFDTFWEGRTQRFHVAMLDEISLVPNKKGGRTLNLKNKAGFSGKFTVEDSALPAAQELVAQVQPALAKIS